MENVIKIDLIGVSQTRNRAGGIYTGKITFGQLFNIHRLTERKESLQDPFGIKNVDYKKEEDEEFQRHLSEKKLHEIKKYINNVINSESATVFPSALIISLDLNENNSEDLSINDVVNQLSSNTDSCFLIKNSLNENLKTLIIPNNPRICLIVDGQHRFYGLRKYYEGLSNNHSKQNQILNFEFITTVLIGLDAYQVGQVFANVNFHQKPVNRSLYYDIFGAASTDNNQIQLAHYLALHLQNNPESPLQGMIKLLGKGYGLFSQAFIVEKLLIHFAPNGVWYELYEDFKRQGSKFLSISEFIKTYFTVIEYRFNGCWPQKVQKGQNLVYSPFTYNYILCKTTGMGAFLRLIKDIFPIVKEFSSFEQRFQIEKIFSHISSEEAKSLFSKHGEYGGAGSEGLQVKLYKVLKYRLRL